MNFPNLIFFKPMHESKELFLTIVTQSPKHTYSKFLQPEKTEEKVVTFGVFANNSLGIEPVKPLQPQNVL